MEKVQKCECEDSDGVVCGRTMTNEELEQDGMCQTCADNVWSEMTNDDVGCHWSHDPMR